MQSLPLGGLGQAAFPLAPTGFSLPDFSLTGRDWEGMCLPQLPPTSVQLLGQAEQVEATRTASKGPGSTTLTLKAAWVPQGGWGEAAGIQILPSRPLQDKGLSLLLLLLPQQIPAPLPSPSSEALRARPQLLTTR